jgi:hypothetical protein
MRRASEGEGEESRGEEEGAEGGEEGFEDDGEEAEGEGEEPEEGNKDQGQDGQGPAICQQDAPEDEEDEETHFDTSQSPARQYSKGRGMFHFIGAALIFARR